ncbi:MAG: sensor histidine kinase [Muricoprocola sp.]
MIKNLRRKFCCTIMVIVTAIFCIIFGMLYSITAANLEKSSIQMMENICRNPGKHGRPDEKEPEVQMPFIRVERDQQGNVLFTEGEYYDLFDEDWLEEILEQADESSRQTGVIKEYSLRFFQEVTPNGRCVVFTDMTREKAVLRQLTRNMILVGVAALFILGGFSYLLAKWMVKPVEQAWIQQKQFVADASHELKTPLTVILANAELMQMNPQEKYVSGILSMAYQMRGLIENLLDLARLDDKMAEKEMEMVSLSDLVEEAILPFEPVFFEQEIELRTEIEPDIILKGNRRYLQQLVDILLDNARKYGQKQGKCEVCLKRAGKRECMLSVANTGEQIPKEDLKNLFKRFYRADKVRSMERSYGLGLAIAESIVHKHGGKIWAESKEGWNTFFVKFSMH